MAHIEEVARIPRFVLLRTQSYLDDPASPWEMFQVRCLDVWRPSNLKKSYMLSWHTAERRLAPSSELRDMNAYNPQLTLWAETQIKLNTIGD